MKKNKDDETFRELRKQRIGMDLMDYMTKLATDTQSESEMADVMQVWCQVLGATVGSMGEQKAVLLNPT